MKMLFVIDALHPGGAQRQMVVLAKHLVDRGHQVEFFVYHEADHFRDTLVDFGVRIHFYQKRGRFSILPIFNLVRLVAIARYDVVLAFLDTPSFYAELACLWRRKTRLVVSERSMYKTDRLGIGLRVLASFHRTADWITVNSHHQRIRMESLFPWMRHKISTIYNGYDLDEFAPQPTLRRSGSSRLELLAIASVAFNKNSINLAKAVDICRRNYGLDLRVRWAGVRHVEADGDLAARETDIFLRQSGIAHLWEWLGVRRDIPQLLAESDALIHTAYFEGLPNSICEALSCGKPVLVSRVCDHPLLVANGERGFLFDPASPDEIAAAILAFSRLSKLQRHRMSIAARDFAKSYLSISRACSEYEQLFHKLVQA